MSVPFPSQHQHGTDYCQLFKFQISQVTLVVYKWKSVSVKIWVIIIWKRSYSLLYKDCYKNFR